MRRRTRRDSSRIEQGRQNGNAVVTVAAGARQAYHQFYDYNYRGDSGDNAQWRIYAFTDRPAYRPGETVQWKILARTRQIRRLGDAGRQPLNYEIMDPRSEKVASGRRKLNAFGSFWSELALTSEMPLGEYNINFNSKNQHRGSAQLFRLEEYKLPEFLVTVSTPEGKQYRTRRHDRGDDRGDYYFGGPVANATVEVVVYQSAVLSLLDSVAPVYDWYYDPPPRSYGGNIVKRETLTTDGDGRAVLRIDTPRTPQT